jgi:O-acetyl-ADP-ribose deacetylase (regulator of RNase III)
MISFAEGDLFGSSIPALAHGVNCRGVMGAGIAVQFRARWPQMYESYRRRCLRGHMLPGDVLAWKTDSGTVIFNLATQDRPGANAQPWMITAAVGRMIQEAFYLYETTEIAMPRIGCGIGGLTQADLLRCLRPYRDAPVNLTVVTLPVREPAEGRQG